MIASSNGRPKTGLSQGKTASPVATPYLNRDATPVAQILARAIEQTDDAVMITRSDGVIEYVNPGFERITGYRAGDIIGRRPSILASGMHPPAFYSELWRTLGRGESFRSVFTNRRSSGELYYEEKTISPIRGADEAISHFVATGKDVTERIAAERRLEYLANYDALTGLPNRSLLHDRLAQAIQRAHRLGKGVAVQFVDLDRFKLINDTLGHNAGDRVLIEAASRLRQCLRATDTVARLGGDEFILIQEGVGNPDEVEQVARKVLDAFAPCFPVAPPQGLFVSVSVGLALYPGDGLTPDELLMRADLAMYRAKEGGRNSFRFFEAAMDASAMRTLTLEAAIRGALDNREFAVVYQPIIDTRTQRPIAVEALMRWHSPVHGTVPPDHFIPLLEENGMIVPVSRWALRQALRQVRTLQCAGQPALRLAFNLSSRQFRDVELLQDVTAALDEAGFDPTLLELELTESALMDNPDASAAVLEALRARGIRVAVDDFGTGYSSLAYLMRFPVRTLKIDRSFVYQMERSKEAATIVRAIASLARSLGLELIGEGVENVGQLALLQEVGCHQVQGFLFSRPVTGAELALSFPH
ncbi:EAL domain-containing protein [Zoogloea sp.]|jgi:diguanylate cyclase (GGDEF)-like protein/PAS domain S-box-containing protein|uniref:putative bifunctional diguanylate cyclase/phosphodiesterase n=1 Tax=Zoogloea sp. TaxID=49181 RepID=UPI001B547F3D|nr:EAL domain-containing protein [Zoogloea sp.]MBK6656483.1 EAL domain-containing protein [Zoogloea sp.]MBK7846058.1 EAL domain-containing protein [Zoogloea sp.]MBP7446127.1 EAL domain-containing protein [Zoogloea sp.]HOY02282.1 EAL domain-containing protein [Zoogloea sp.]HPI60084.1 EAL domain-containing protein [Zoogloea sp.]